MVFPFFFKFTFLSSESFNYFFMYILEISHYLKACDLINEVSPPIHLMTSYTLHVWRPLRFEYYICMFLLNTFSISAGSFLFLFLDLVYFYTNYIIYKEIVLFSPFKLLHKSLLSLT